MRGRGKALVRSLVTFTLICAAVALRGSQAQRAQGRSDFEKSVLPFLVENCYACHNARRKSGELNLEQFKTAASMIRQRETWERVLQKLQACENAPKGPPGPNPAQH